MARRPAHLDGFDSIIQMLTNIANDLDQLLTDLCHNHPAGYPHPHHPHLHHHHHPFPPPGDGDGGGGGGGGGVGLVLGEHTLNTLTQHSGDTLGKDSFLSSVEAASRRLGDTTTTGSSQSLLSSSGSDNLSVDSGHDERTQGTSSPLVFDPNHFGSRPKSLDTSTTTTTTTTAATMTPPYPAPAARSHDNESVSSGELRPVNLAERLAKTHSIWLLTQMSRAGAVHLLKDRETGVFIIRKSSQSMSLALSVQNRQTDQANVDHYLIEASDYGMRLQGSAHFFHSIPSLIAHYIENLDELPYRLTLPAAILQARSSRELASLAMLGQDFWLSPVSRKLRLPSPASGPLHKSCSEPIDIRQPLQTPAATQHIPNTPPLHTLPAHSVSDFSDFVSTRQVEEEQQQVFREQFSAQIASPHPRHRSPPAPTTNPPRTVVATSSQNRTQVGFGPHVLRLRGLNDTPISTDSSGGEEGGGGSSSTPHIQLVGAFPAPSCAMSDASSQTDFSSLKEHQPIGRPNLYSMTPVELLNLPENTYFRSSLSDKMSDYEDIWRSSYYDTDSVKNGSVKGAGASGYEVGSCVTARSDFSKFFAVNGNKDGMEERPVSAVITTSADTPPVLTLSAVPPPPPVSDKVCVNPKLLHPVGRLTRLKSSSESSLATLASPVYAEPADAVVFRERPGQTSRSRVRRRSAPSVSSQAAPDNVAKQSSHAAKPSTFFPFSTKDRDDNTQSRKASAAAQPKKLSSSMTRVRSGGGMSRSQSMRTHQEVARLAQKRPGWQERFNRLKLGTKVLSHSGSPYAATSQGTKPQLDESLFVVQENPAMRGGVSVGGSPDTTTTTPTLNKFPVYQRSRPIHAVNRGSVFSESSTVQDIISCAMPELMVRPIQTQHLTVHAHKPLSEYDNFNPYAPPSASSHGTIFCTPWEGGVADTLMRSTSSKTQLPPAMNLQERVQKWQEANQTFHQHQQQQQQHHHQQQPPLTREQELRQQQLKVGVTKPLPSSSLPAQVTAVQAVGGGGEVPRASSKVSVDTGSVLSVQGHIAASPHQPHHHHHPHNTTATTTTPATQPRPQSMYYPSQSATKQQLTRSFSNPHQPQQQQQLPHHHHHHHQQQQLHHHLLLQQQLQHSRPHQQRAGLRPTFTESSSITPDSQTGGLSSNCPDVINCHHVAVDVVGTGNNAGSDDEAWAHSLTSTLQHGGQNVSQRKRIPQDPGSKIRDYIFKLSQDRSTTFGSTIENFIQCTVESQERTPHHVMRNVRQFMSGIKNYLVKHGEGQLEDLIETERNKLGSNEILNIDALIETTLHMCVLRPLKHHIYRLFVEFHGRNNSLELMSRNIKYARTKTAEEIGIKPGLIPPQSGDMERIKHYLDKMQRAYSPLKKLENLLSATSAIYACVKVQGKQQKHHVPSRGPASLGADDFLPLLIYVLVHCGLVSAEIEADYMWGLLHPSVLTGEGGYYLTTLSSAVLILKNFQEAHESKTASLEGHLPTLGEVQGFLKIAFPDELRDTILWKTLPVRPNMTTKDVCAMIAHKFKITNPQDYGLILLCNGEESQLQDQQCPQILKKDNLAAGRETFFAYKRLGANIAWPSSIKHT
ncbi:uncharacterized protein LOC143295940 isoform X2 [Babylonia areolata]|uniref:uncharacterized protein LOC143295940 isoform X2 n=1 Tax=Babylonia areolata TaxID=304850 RepID=UPI003FD094FB